MNKYHLYNGQIDEDINEEGILEAIFYDYFYKNNTENFEELPSLLESASAFR